MPTLSELTLTLLLRRDERSGRTWTVLRIATVREFRSFRYEIQVEDTSSLEARTIALKVQGVQAPAGLMPGTGPAIREIAYPDLDGEYAVTIQGSRQGTSFRIRVAGDTIAPAELPADNLLRIDIEKGVEIVRT